MPVLAQIKKNTTEELYYFYNDNLGSKKAAIKASDQTVETFEYTTFGEVVIGSIENASFTGKQLDATGLYYFNARYYDPEVKRFITEDPAKQGSGWYTYCNNNPINLVDPDGKESPSLTLNPVFNFSPIAEGITGVASGLGLAGGVAIGTLGIAALCGIKYGSNGMGLWDEMYGDGGIYNPGLNENINFTTMVGMGLLAKILSKTQVKTKTQKGFMLGNVFPNEISLPENNPDKRYRSPHAGKSGLYENYGSYLDSMIPYKSGSRVDEDGNLIKILIKVQRDPDNNIILAQIRDGMHGALMLMDTYGRNVELEDPRIANEWTEIPFTDPLGTPLEKGKLPPLINMINKGFGPNLFFWYDLWKSGGAYFNKY